MKIVQSAPRAMVMAAGAGTRLRPLTHEIPKPMVPILNRPVLEFTVENLKRHGIQEMIFNLHSHPQLIQKHFGDGRRFGVSISYSHEKRLMGTAGGVKKAESFLNKGTFLVMSGDGLTSVNLSALLDFHRRRRSVGTLGLKPIDTRFEYGVTVTRANGRIQRFVEKPLWSEVFSNLVNTGIYVFEASVLRQIPPRRFYDFGSQLWPQLLKRKAPIYGFPVNDYWCDVGNLSEYRKAQRDFLSGKVGFPIPGRQIRKGVWIEEGVKLAPGVKLEAPCLIGRGSTIQRGARIGAFTVIGARAQIAPKSALNNCVLWDDVQVGSGVRLENCVVGHRARVIENISTFEGSVILTP